MRISDWSSDVCSSDLSADELAQAIAALGGTLAASSDPDATVFSANAPATNIEAAANLIPDVAIRPGFAPDALRGSRNQPSSCLAAAGTQPVQQARPGLLPARVGQSPQGLLPPC